MKKLIIKKIRTSAIISIVIMALLVFVFQWMVSRNNASITCDERLSDAVTRIDESEVTIKELTENLNIEYISKANAFAEMIRLDPEIIDNADELERIREMLEVDELHVTDDKGVIYWGTVPGYFGFDFNTSEQTKPFLPILTDDTLEIAQEAQPNGTEGKLFQYISVPRRDATGIVQIGMEPVRLTETLADNQPDVILGNIKVGTNGTIFAVNKTDLTIAAFFDSSYIGKNISELGIDEASLKDHVAGVTNYVFCGTSFYSKLIEHGNYYLAALIPTSEVMGEAALLTGIVALLALLVIVLLVFIVIKAINKNIIVGMTKITEDIKAISDGNADVRVDVRTCDEFCILSDGINGMVDHIEANVSAANEMNHSMAELLSKVDDISHSINNYAAEMDNVSGQLSDGATTQAATIQQLSAAFSDISKDVNDNASSARNANAIAEETNEQLRLNMQNMKNMQESMVQINDASQKISNIVKTIEDIAFQTNILALNASIEAARAGVHGKGFAVVAEEVRNLATKSAEAAKDTTELIDETLQAVENGILIVDETAEKLNDTTKSIDKSTQLISEIADATIKQAQSIDEAVEGMNRISAVVQDNTKIAHSAQTTAALLDTEAGKLLEMVESSSRA
ncbi:MAG: hypothetical protein J6A16_09365 [Oscillospiraceae bacterium]|nr:hypothetical protein [Oscillospiraceae bacterium]